MKYSFPSAVQWHEGMLLSPQHFQFADYKLQKIVQNLGNILSPFCYGVHLFKLDTSCIAAATVRILEVSGVFQDGLMFEYDAMSDVPLERNFKEQLAATSQNIKIYLGIFRHDHGTNLLEGNSPRYVSSAITNLKDENTGEAPVDLPVLRPKLQLLLQEELDARYVSFPLLEIKKSDANGIDVINYVPPTLSFDLHSRVLDLVRNVVHQLRNKINFFSDRKGNASFIVGEEVKNNLKTLVQASLQLETIIKIDRLSPFTYYQYLLQTSTLLASMNSEQLVPILPSYNHEEIFDVFSRLCDFCIKSLDFLKQPFGTLPFVKSDNGVFKMMMRDDLMQQDELIISVKRPFSASDNELLAWVNGMQIASDSSISIIKDRRILGAERRVIERGERVIPPAGAILVAIKRDNPYLRSKENLCIFNNSEDVIDPEEIVLYVDK